MAFRSPIRRRRDGSYTVDLGPNERELLVSMCDQMRDLLKPLPSLIDVSIRDDQKFTICGDIHGQYYDLLNIFKINGMPSEENPYVSLLAKLLQKLIT